MFKFLLIFCILFINYFSILSEETKPHYYGAFIGPSYIMNNTKLQIFQGADDCGTYSNGSNIAFNFGIFYTYQNYENLIDFDFRLLYEKRPITLTEQFSKYEIYNNQVKSYQPLVLKYQFDGSLEYIAIDLGVKYKPLKEFPAFLRLGIDAGNPIISADYENSEMIVSPTGILFPDETIKHPISKGKMNNAGTALGINLSVSYKYPLKNGLIIEPALTYRKSLNSVLNDQQWNQDIVRLTFSVGIEKSSEQLPDNPKIDTTTTNATPLQDLITLQPAAPPNGDFNTTNIKLLETTVTQTYPILPYIFFNSDNSDLKSVYSVKNSNNFDESKLADDNLTIYYDILNIIGSRMNKYPNSNLTINGTQDGKENLVSTDFSLAKERADKIAYYLANNWKIDKKRLKTGFIKKPTLPTSETYIEGFEENRRVELVSDDFRITEPVIHRKFSEFKNLTTQVFFDVKNNEKIKNWELSIRHNNLEIKNLKGVDKVPDIFKIEDIAGNLKLKNSDELKAKLTIEFNDLPNKTSLTKNITIETDKNIFETGRLNLIVFDFDKSEITDFNQYMIENFVKSEVQTTSVLKVTGSTDKLGEALYNEKLSQQRADNVSQYLRKMIPNVNIKESKGVGFNQNNIDNDIPEGRFYSRTVLIEVETPVK